jgi:cell division protein FtsB
VIRRLLLFAFILFVVYFAIEGGEYGSWDLWSQRKEKLNLQRVNDSLSRKVDSLRRYRAQLDTDRALQEKLARETIGMVRGDKELVYQIGPPDTGAKPAKKPPNE